MYNMKQKNGDTNVKSGDEFHMDYLVGKKSATGASASPATTSSR
jgi:hypothetical protein